MIERDRISSLARAGQDAALLIVGDEGSGKTRLLESVSAEVGGVLIRVNPAEAAWPLSGLSTVFASLRDPRAAEFSGRFHLRSTDADDIYAAAQDLLTMLRGLSLPPVPLLIDDIDRMDPESRALLGAMAPRLAGTGLRFAASSRPPAHDDPLRGLDTIRLAALDDDEAFALLSGVADPASHEGTLRILVRQGGGNPGALLESLRALTAEQLRGREPLVLPLRRAGAYSKASRIVGRARAIVDTVALAPGTPIALLRSVDGELDAVDELIGDGVLATTDHAVRIADPLLRSHVHWTIDPERRRLRHRELAVAARRSGAVAAAVWHASFSAPRGAAPVLMNAAADLARDGDTGSAVEFSERALRLEAPSRDDAASILDLAAGFESALEPALASRVLLRMPADDPAPPVAIRTATLAAVIRFRRMRQIASGEVLDAVELLGASAPDEAVEGVGVLAAFHASRWEAPAARELLASAAALVEHARPAVADFYHAVAAFTDAVEGLPAADLSGFVSRARDGRESDERIDRLLLVVGRAMTLREEYDAARHTFAMVSRPRASGLARQESGLVFAAENSIRQGDWVRAQEAIAQWLEIAGSRPRSSSRTLLEAWYAFACGTGDAWRELAKLCAQRAAAERNSAVAARLRALQGEVALFAGDVEGAERHLRLAASAAERIANPQLVRHGADLVHALMRAGRLREAENAAAELQSLRRRFPSRWLTLAAARAAALVATPDRGIRLHDEAIALFRPEDSRIELAKVLLGRADVEARTGRSLEHAVTLRTIATTLEHAGARSWIRFDRRPEEDASRWNVSFGLTPDEIEVVRLLRQGYRNKQIAAALYVSLRTVELRVTRVFRKTGATTRAELIALLDRPVDAA